MENIKKINLHGTEYDLGFSSNDFTDALKSKLDNISANAQVNIIESILLNGQQVSVQNKQVNLGNLQKTLKAGAGINIASDGTITSTLDIGVFKIVDTLPESPEANNENKIHVVSNPSGPTGNVYNEYLWDGSKWEELGNFKADVDLSEYAKTKDVDAKLSNKVDKVPGKELSTNDYTTIEKTKLSNISSDANKVEMSVVDDTLTIVIS